MVTLNSESDVHSLLTKISAYESAASTPRSICLHTDDRFIGFEKNDDPHTAQWMETKLERIGWHKIGSKGIETLEQGLYVNQGIKYLNFSGCNIRDEGVISLAKALNGNESCEHLDISHNSLSTRSGSAISDLLSKTRIQVLNISWNELSSHDCVTKIFEGLKQSTHTKAIDYSWNGLSSSEWVKSLKKAMLKNETLEKLNLENNRLNGVADQIMPAISKSSSLREVYVGDNPWNEQDWKNIVNVYLKPSNLNVLGLGTHTYLTEECVLLIRKAMRVNPELKFIYQGQIKEQPATDVNFKNILIDRLKALALKPKKKKLRKNMGHFFLKLKTENIEYVDPDNFAETLAAFGAKLDQRLIEQVVDEFTTEVFIKNKKTGKVPLLDVADYYLARHPTEPPKVKPGKKKKKKKKQGDKKENPEKKDDKKKDKMKDGKKKRNKKKKTK
ncbi:hypothetical protein HA402_005933 [Bradysia odoriphaga]|nr:hypothetical protein HA402_005933 [Bradysia odoriphaga]